MGKTDSKWRGYVSRHSKKGRDTVRRGTITDGAQATARLGGGTNRVAGAEIGNATGNLRHWPREGGSVL